MFAFSRVHAHMQDHVRVKRSLVAGQTITSGSELVVTDGLGVSCWYLTIIYMYIIASYTGIIIVSMWGYAGTSATVLIIDPRNLTFCS